MPKQFVFIMTDTQRFDMLGCYGSPQLKTPRLDQLAAEGVRFEQAYTCQPVCGPARSALFTGTYPHSNGAWGNSMSMGENVKTIGQRLTDQNVHTAYIGKWHLDGGDYFGNGTCPDGWDADYWYDMRNYLEELDEKDRKRSRKESTNQENIPADFTFGHRCSNRAIEFLEKHKDEDYLLVVSYDEPHGPFLCPEPFASMHKETTFPKRRAFFDNSQEKPVHQKTWAQTVGVRSEEENEKADNCYPDFFGCNSFVDHEIGRVIDAVNENAPDALIMYTSDHGDFLGNHNLEGKGAAMYDDITHIPLIARWPDNSPEQTTCTHPVSHISVAPTILEYFGVTPSKVLEGESLLPTLCEPDKKPTDQIFIEFNRYEIDHDGFGGFQPIRCAFDGRFKLSINLLSSDELYDLKNDPDEVENLIDAEEHASVRNQLHDRIMQWMDETRDPFRGYQWWHRPWRTDAPDATWDCSGMTRQRQEDGCYEIRQLDYDTGLEITEAVRPK